MLANYTIAITNLVTNTTHDESSILYAHKSCKIKVAIVDNYSSTYRKIIRWNFGDGTIVKGTNAIHSYKLPGKYTISCTFYNIDGSPVENEITKSVIVKEAIPTQLSFLNPNEWKESYPISKNNKLGTLLVSISNNIISEPLVSVVRSWKDGNKENSYFDIKNEYYYHLKKYYTFLEKRLSHSIGSSFTQSILQPCNELSVQYIPLYGLYIKDKGKMRLETYYINYNNNEILSNKFNAIRINSKSELPEGSSLLGKVGILDIWYKNDYESENNLIFEFKKDTIKFENEPETSDFYLNIPPLGITTNTVKTNNEIIEAITSNGIFNTNYCEDTNIINVETYLRHNFYLNYSVEAYYSKFIKNDSIDGETTYNMLKCKTDLKNLSQSDAKTQCLVENIENKEYYSIYNITPKSPLGFKLYYNDLEEEYFSVSEVVELNSLILPAEKKTNINIDELLSVYMDHPMYEDATNLKTFLRDILKNKNMLSYSVSKGANILNDIVNYKTCHLDKLLSILKMLGEDVKYYDINSFDRVNELKEMIRILTMNYSDLFGNLLKKQYDIGFTATSKGKNVDAQLLATDVILVNENKEIIAIRRGSKILPLTTKTPYLILKDDFTLQSTLVSFAGIEAITLEDFSDQTPEWINQHQDFINNIVYAYKLDDYDEKWGWVLNLPIEYKDKTEKTLVIDTYYSFYLFNPIISSIRKYNFIDENTIPMSKIDKDEQITVEEWNDDYGFTYDCLMKILISILMFNDSN